MAPMTTWLANDDGTVSDEEVSYYRRRVNGVGLVLTGCTHVTPNGIGFTGEFASYEKQTIINLVAAGIGSAIVPRWTAKLAVAGVTFVPLVSAEGASLRNCH